MQAFAKIEGQISSGPLVPGEQFGAGGQDSVRGYLESTALGDDGLAGSIELRTPPVGTLFRLTSISDWRFFAFFDGAVLKVRDALPEQQSSFDLASYGAGNQWQYFGLATPFHELAITGKLDYGHFDPFHIWLAGEYVQNLAFDRNAIENSGPSKLRGPVNNIGPGGVFNGGNTAWIATLNLGHVAMEKAWDWAGCFSLPETALFEPRMQMPTKPASGRPCAAPCSKREPLKTSVLCWKPATPN